MAEERISIHHCSNKCRHLREISGACDMVKEECMANGTYCTAYIHGQWQKIDPEKDCKDCKRAEYDGMTRSETVKRMADAMAVPYFNDVHASELDMLEALAEAALDTLIEIYRRNLSNKAGI